MPTDEDFLFAAAVHEVGHAIVAWELGLQVESLVVGQRRDGSGESRLGDPPDLSIEDRVVILQGGGVAVHEVLKVRTHDKQSHADQAKIAALLIDYPEAERDRLPVEARDRALQILRNDRRALERIAKKLKSAGTMDGASFRIEMIMARATDAKTD
jgi:hypothetical protein